MTRPWAGWARSHGAIFEMNPIRTNPPSGGNVAARSASGPAGPRRRKNTPALSQPVAGAGAEYSRVWVASEVSSVVVGRSVIAPLRIGLGGPLNRGRKMNHKGTKTRRPCLGADGWVGWRHNLRSH